MCDLPSVLTWESYYEIWMRVLFWQMFVFVGLNASSKKHTVSSLWEARLLACKQSQRILFITMPFKLHFMDAANQKALFF